VTLPEKKGENRRKEESGPSDLREGRKGPAMKKRRNTAALLSPRREDTEVSLATDEGEKTKGWRSLFPIGRIGKRGEAKLLLKGKKKRDGVCSPRIP